MGEKNNDNQGREDSKSSPFARYKKSLLEKPKAEEELFPAGVKETAKASELLPELEKEGERTQRLYEEAVETVKTCLGKKGENKEARNERIIQVVEKLALRLKSGDSNLVGLTSKFSPENYLPCHSVNVAILALRLGLSLGYSKEQLIDLGVMALLHDIRRVSLSKETLQKFKELSEGPYCEVTDHSAFNLMLMDKVRGLSQLTLDILKQHQEEISFNWSLDDKTSEYIELIAMIDLYEALVHPQTYKRRFTPFSAMKIIIELSTSLLNPKLVKLMVDKFSIYPIGSIVRLSNNEIGEIIGGSSGYILRPLVKVVIGSDGQELERPKLVNLAKNALLNITSVIPKKEVSKEYGGKIPEEKDFPVKVKGAADGLPSFLEGGPAPKKIWAIGGGKGGVGKSLITANIGVGLAKLGKKVILVDGDLGGADLHTCLGLKRLPYTIGDFLTGRKDELDKILVDTPVENLKLIGGDSEMLGSANIPYQTKQKFLKHLKMLEADYILLDLGGGTSYNTLDFFSVTDEGIIVAIPEPSSLWDAYAFLKTSVYRALSGAIGKTSPVRSLILQATDPNNEKGIMTTNDLLEEVKKIDQDSAEILVQNLKKTHPKFILNMAESRRDCQINNVMSKLAKENLGIELEYLGEIVMDKKVKRALKNITPFTIDNPKSNASICIYNIIVNLLNYEEGRPIRKRIIKGIKKERSWTRKKIEIQYFGAPLSREEIIERLDWTKEPAMREVLTELLK